MNKFVAEEKTKAIVFNMLFFLVLILQAATLGIARAGSNSSISNSNGAAVTTKRVGVVISDGFELLDAMGPFETLKEVEERYYSQIDLPNRRWDKEKDSGIQCSGGRLEIKVHLASFKTDPVKSSSGLFVQPEVDLALDESAFTYDLLVLGAGSLDPSDPTAMKYVQKHHDRGGSILTVCTGAKVVASLGLLDSTTATTNSLFLELYKQTFPAVNWISLADNLERRFVRSTPQIITTAGITAGIDGSLHLVEEWCGTEVAEATRECLEWPLSIQQLQEHDTTRSIS